MNTASVSISTGAPDGLPVDCPVAAGEAASARWPVSLLGVPFDNLTIADTLARIDAIVAAREPRYIVTANVDFLVQAQRDVELRRILLEAELVLCDGTPLLWASRWLGNPLPERVAGSDLAPSLLANAARRGHRVFLLGAGPGVAAAAADRLQQQYPALNLVGHYAPPFAALLEMDHDEIARRIRTAQPDILLVSFGCPKQEKWIAMHHRALGVPVSIGVGATIDFLAGRVRRAPDWMRRSGVEWLFRLALEPRRLFRRYAKDVFFFLPTFAAQWSRLALRTPRRKVAHPSIASSCLALDREFTRSTLERNRRWRDELVSPSAASVLDASAVEHIDATGTAFLVRWQKAQRARGRQLVLLAPSTPLRRTLAALRLTDYFPTAHSAADAQSLAEAAAAQKSVLPDSTARTLGWCGEIVAANIDEVWTATTNHVSALAAQHAALVLVDLSRLRFIDSAAAGLMLRLKKWARSLSVEIVFTGAQPNIRNVLRLTRLDRVLLEGGR